MRVCAEGDPGKLAFGKTVGAFNSGPEAESSQSEITDYDVTVSCFFSILIQGVEEHKRIISPPMVAKCLHALLEIESKNCKIEPLGRKLKIDCFDFLKSTRNPEKGGMLSLGRE